MVGYGTQSSKLVTTSISKVKLDDIDQANDYNPIKMLQGRVPGVNISNSSGTPGATPNIQVRGVGSINGGSKASLCGRWYSGRVLSKYQSVGYRKYRGAERCFGSGNIRFACQFGSSDYHYQERKRAALLRLMFRAVSASGETCQRISRWQMLRNMPTQCRLPLTIIMSRWGRMCSFICPL